jgi:hypothetical protein
MINVRFGSNSDGSIDLGAYPAFLLSSDALCAGPDWQVIAVYREHTWQVGGQRFVCLNFTERGLRLVICNYALEMPLGRFGPFDEVLVADGALIADDKPFAKFNEDTMVWYVYPTKTSLPNILIEVGDSSASTALEAGGAVDMAQDASSAVEHGTEG